ncbi:cupin domain-containing protein [Ectothiorhodospiraceae bacterium WFHF3C12]|nr:cupin domain-containing protein [Ectothiorhodospiraceae bacterium WFHF3C12]
MANTAQTQSDQLKHAYWPDGSTIVRAEQVPWTEWALPGTWFKLLDYDRNRSYSVILLRIEPTAPATPHKHIGAANAYILEGGFSYEHGEVRAGDFMVEAGGVTHTPQIHSDGCVLLGFMYGVVAGFEEDGSLAGVVDVDWMIDQARANDAFAHLEDVVRT